MHAVLSQANNFVQNAFEFGCELFPEFYLSWLYKLTRINHQLLMVRSPSRKKKVMLMLFLLTGLVIFCTTYFCNQAIENSASGKLYTETEQIPFNNVGLLLGTSRYGRKGFINPYYDYRIKATLRLLNAGKINYLVISGDNGHSDYNEPEMMRADLMKAGIDSSIIYLDYAGFRTFDSVVRLKKIFGQTSTTVISQQFHNERAIYIASQEGIDAIGFNAKDVSSKSGIRIQLREKLARVKVFLDYWSGAEPKFLGEQIEIPKQKKRGD